MFLGLRTVIYGVSDIEKAKEWYSRVLGFEPYFSSENYVGFDVGGYELGLDPNVPAGNSGGVIAYWGVEDAEATQQQLVTMGAIATYPVQDVGDSILIGAVTDPFGNLLGFVKNPHFSLPGKAG